jgi:hypothetical protein
MRGTDDNGARARATLLQVLVYILKLEMTLPRWERLASVIELAAEALAAGDLEALRQAISELQLADQVRVVRIGTAPAVPPPPKVRERVNYLVYELRGADADEDEE